MIQNHNNQIVHYGSQCPSPQEWFPFNWEEPKSGKRTFGEITFARRFGTSGDITAGFWRIAATSPGVEFDSTGVTRLLYSAPLGDQTICVIDGTALIKVSSTGQAYEIGPGSIVTLPKGLEVEWAFQAPFFKSYWSIWNGTSPNHEPLQRVLINHTNDNPKSWTPYKRVDPEQGELVSGELYMIAAKGTSGSMRSGVWRAGRGIPSTNVDETGEMINPYTGATGDETMLLLEGEVEIIETESGKKHLFRAGDALGLSAGMNVTWISRGPFTKKLWVITRD